MKRIATAPGLKVREIVIRGPTSGQDEEICTLEWMKRKLVSRRQNSR
jgi:hypothetical protein